MEEAKVNFTMMIIIYSLTKVALYDPQCRGYDYVDTHIKYLAFNSFYSHNAITNNSLPKDEFLSLKELSKLDDVIVTKPDKGNGIVLLNKHDYV